MSEPGQPECTKRRVRREEQCLSNIEWVDGHICPCRVCEGERERDGGREVLRAFLVFCRQAIPPEIYLGNVS